MNRNAPAPIIHRFVPQTADCLFVEAQRLGADHILRRMGLHGHTFFELLLIESGAGRHRVGRTAFTARPGDLFIIRPGELHDCKELGDAQGWVLLFTHQAMEGDAPSSAFCRSWLPRHPLFLPFLELSRGQHGPIRLDKPGRERWSGHISAIAHEIEARTMHYQYGVHAHLSLLLLDLCRLTGPTRELGMLGGDPVMEAVFDFIDHNYQRPISLGDLARAAGRSPAHLTTFLRQRTGLSAQEWIAERRMSEARRLLVESNKSIEEIASEVGYFDPASLIRRFVRLHRLTPGAWRQAHRGDPAYH
jgi:AraC-like DNA-binding protein